MLCPLDPFFRSLGNRPPFRLIFPERRSGVWRLRPCRFFRAQTENKVSGSQAGEKKAMLLASIHLVCRPHPFDAPVGDWGAVIRELPRRVGDWMERLQLEGVRGADLVFACIGPALEIYSQYSKVVDAEDREIPLGGDPEAVEPFRRGYLAYIWEAVGRAALEQVLGTAAASARNGAAGALEEDARLTALFLWTLQSTNGEQATGNGQQAVEKESDDEEDEEEDTPKKKKKGLTLVFDVARRFAQPLGIHLDNWKTGSSRRRRELFGCFLLRSGASSFLDTMART